MKAAASELRALVGVEDVRLAVTSQSILQRLDAERRLRTYSSGMFLRLAFAISTSIEPDILIMDEMISAGDAQFIAKAERRLRELVDKANILVLASHDMKIIQQMCNKIAWLEHGDFKQFGPSEAVIPAYAAATT